MFNHALVLSWPGSGGWGRARPLCSLCWPLPRPPASLGARPGECMRSLGPGAPPPAPIPVPACPPPPASPRPVKSPSETPPQPACRAPLARAQTGPHPGTPHKAPGAPHQPLGPGGDCAWLPRDTPLTLRVSPRPGRPRPPRAWSGGVQASRCVRAAPAQQRLARGLPTACWKVGPGCGSPPTPQATPASQGPPFPPGLTSLLALLRWAAISRSLSPRALASL